MRSFLVVLQFLLLSLITVEEIQCIPLFRQSFPLRKAISFSYRGGRIASSKAKLSDQSLDIFVTTSVGSAVLDKKKKISVPLSTTVYELKQLIQQKFPGSPPIILQRLFHSDQLLSNDTQALVNITSIRSNPVLLLDMISGSGGYNRNFSIHQAVEAYASTVVHLAYIGDKLKSTVSSTTEPDGEFPLNSSSSALCSGIEMLHYRELFDIVNASLFDKYADDIAYAKEIEKNPEYFSPDTAKWRVNTEEHEGSISGKSSSPLLAAIAKEFDLNINGIKSYIFFSIILLVTAMFGSSTDTGTLMILACIPLLWISKVRQLRLVFKVIVFVFLWLRCFLFPSRLFEMLF
jgi:hypothetical protein